MKSVLSVLTALLFFVGLSMAQTNDQAQPATSGNQATANQTQNATPADQNATQSTTTQTTTTRRHHRGAAAANQNGAADQNGAAANGATGTNANANGGNLPQTASPLPLLGLLGMGSLGIGAVSRRKRK